MPSATATAGDCLSVELIRRVLTSDLVGRHLCVLWDVPSTSDVLRRMAAAGAAPGTVVLAESQSAGRARAGKRWFSPPGLNLYASVLLRPAIAVEAVPVFAFAAPLATGDAIGGEGLPGLLRWPNDVVVGRLKVAGTLVECSAPGGTVEHVILGIGVNLNVDRTALDAALGDAARDAASLRELTGREIDRNAFAGTLLTRLDRWVRAYAREGPAPLLAAWRERDSLRGRRVEVPGGWEACKGWARGVGPDGCLLVEDDLGRIRGVADGEIRVID